jgi:hypothetical protein
MANNGDASPELTALRSTAFYCELRPFAKTRAAKYDFIKDFKVREEDDDAIEPHDAFFIAADFILGDLLRNVKSRLWIRAALEKMLNADAVDVIGAHFLYRSYLDELVVVMERLQRLIALTALGFKDEGFIKQCEVDVLQFFNPLLHDKRNASHHSLYMGYPRSYEVETAADRIKDDATNQYCVRLFREVMGKELVWIHGTEAKFADFLRGLLDRVNQFFKHNNEYREPANLPRDFSLITPLEWKLRRKLAHKEIFSRENP